MRSRKKRAAASVCAAVIMAVTAATASFARAAAVDYAGAESVWGRTVIESGAQTRITQKSSGSQKMETASGGQKKPEETADIQKEPETAGNSREPKEGDTVRKEPETADIQKELEEAAVIQKDSEAAAGSQQEPGESAVSQKKPEEAAASQIPVNTDSPDSLAEPAGDSAAMLTESTTEKADSVARVDADGKISYFSSLHDAFKKQGKSVKVTLLRDVEIDKQQIILYDTGCKYELDLNGKVIQVIGSIYNSPFIDVRATTLLMKDSGVGGCIASKSENFLIMDVLVFRMREDLSFIVVQYRGFIMGLVAVVMIQM